MKITLTVIGSPLSVKAKQEEEDRKQDSGSESEMIALDYSENTTSRHSKLVRIPILT